MSEADCRTVGLRTKELSALTRPNLLFIMTDQQNPDYVGYAGKGKAITPNMDWIAAGTSFANAISPNPVCTPTRCAILTGKYPHQVGMMTMSGDLSFQHPTYMKALQKAGYFTAGIGKFHYLQGWHWDVGRGRGHDLVALKERIKQYGFDYVWEAAGKELARTNYCDYGAYLAERGLLERYRDELQRRKPFGHPEEPATSESFGIPEAHHVEVVIADRVIETIRGRDSDKPFCLFASFLSPHPMIDPPQRLLDASWEEDGEFLCRDGEPEMPEELQRRWRRNIRGYRALIHLVDEQIGRILEALREQGQLDNTLIVFCSDHGDMLGSFGLSGKNVPWRESATVPLAIRHPGHVTGRRTAAPVSLIDVTATLLDAAGLDPRAELSLPWPAWNHIVPCRSLLPIVRGETDRVRDYTFTENDCWEMVQTERYKFIRYRTIAGEYEPPRERLFDLQADPLELHDLIDDPALAEVAAWMRERRDFVLNSTPAGQIRWAPVLAEEYRLPN